MEEIGQSHYYLGMVIGRERKMRRGREESRGGKWRVEGRGERFTLYLSHGKGDTAQWHLGNQYHSLQRVCLLSSSPAPLLPHFNITSFYLSIPLLIAL